jgi:hypothetical protein
MQVVCCLLKLRKLVDDKAVIGFIGWKGRVYRVTNRY